MTIVKTREDATSYREAMEIIGLEPRRQQEQLADLIRQEDGVRACEAPTATGKSLAALIGGALHVKEHGGRVVIATYTNLLREQYEDSEIPAARRAFPGVKFYSVAGASNYLCANRANDAAENAPAWARAGLQTIRDRLRSDPSHTLLVSTVPDKFRGFAAANSDACGDDSRCKTEDGSGCGFRNARRGATTADVVITNHALLAINAQLNGLLIGTFAVTVVDECHKLPAALKDQLTRRVTSRGLIQKASILQGSYSIVTDLADAIDEIETVDGKDWENWPGEFDRTRLSGLTKHAVRAVSARVATLESDLEEHVQDREVGKFNPKCPECRSLSQDLTDARQLDRNAGTVKDWLTCCELNTREESGLVGTVEIRGSGEKSYPRLNVIPTRLDKAARALVETTDNLVFMSATVGSVSDPVYSLTACGIADSLDETVFLDHALDYPGQMDVVIDTQFDLLTRLDRAIDTYAGSALVLVASHKMKELVTARVESSVQGRIRVFSQPNAEKSADRARIFTEFRDDRDSVLIGTESYYEGVNAPGDTLRHVVIASLPRREWGPVAQQIDANLRLGGGSFHQVHQAPRIEMVLQQMMGRLIRSTGDYGRVSVIADGVSSAWDNARVMNAISRFGAVPVHRLS